MCRRTHINISRVHLLLCLQMIPLSKLDYASQLRGCMSSQKFKFCLKWRAPNRFEVINTANLCSSENIFLQIGEIRLMVPHFLDRKICLSCLFVEIGEFTIFGWIPNTTRCYKVPQFTLLLNVNCHIIISFCSWKVAL